MFRNIGAALVGLFTAFVLIYIVEMIGHAIYPPPQGLDFSDADAMGAYIASMPIMALLFPMFAWVAGTFMGAFLAICLGTRRPIIFASVVGVFVLAGTITNLIWIPHPLWYSITAVVGIVVSAWLAVLLAPSCRAKREE